MTLFDTRGSVITSGLDTRGSKVTNDLTTRGSVVSTKTYTNTGLAKATNHIEYFTLGWDYPGYLESGSTPNDTAYPVHAVDVRTSLGTTWTASDPNETGPYPSGLGPIGSVTDLANRKAYFEGLGLGFRVHHLPVLSDPTTEAAFVNDILDVCDHMYFDEEPAWTVGGTSAINTFMTAIRVEHPDARLGCIYSWLASERSAMNISTWINWVDFLMIAAYWPDSARRPPQPAISSATVEAWLNDLRTGANSDAPSMPLEWIFYSNDPDPWRFWVAINKLRTYGEEMHPWRKGIWSLQNIMFFQELPTFMVSGSAALSGTGTLSGSGLAV